MIAPVGQANDNEVNQAISLDNICMLDGSWTASDRFSGCGWIWTNSAENVQLMGTRNFTRCGSALHSEVEALRWAMENMLQHSPCQRFGTDCKELIAMIKEPQEWPSFATELEKIETLQICFPEFEIIYVPRYRSLSLVSKTFRSLISSPELYTVRSQIGNTEPCLCIRQELPTHDRWYILDQTLVTTTNSNGLIKDEFNLLPITSSSLSKSTTLAVGFEIYQIGGDQLPSSTVRVLDFRTRTWRDAPDMGVARKCPESALIDSKIYVVGGGTEESEVFDLKSQTWNPLPSLSDDGDYPEVQLRRGELFATTSKHKNVVDRKLMWYEHGHWFSVKGLKDVCTNPYVNHHTTILLANHGGGNILVIWDEPHSLKFPVAGKMRKHVCKNRRIWCAVIKFEKRFFGLKFEVWGKVVRSNALLTVPKSFKLLSCVTL
ncbi:putative F-box/kelch-repeat protein At4g35120 [Brassica rapa]|uniref:putative F-box/kelch-repeat protein At4g35120 n=1 Tax=Brassica campestris TaxID=3711 RepID=UPI00142DFE10|nr:putative F-box/kelch-repeat protein At4g35120 [Brassica rapa]